ncbi:ATP-binding protein [Sphaerothrix gracilis]|uniref:ATP-binding protein n=1 Tax=Sphaerothrix gracilis TaxID=3151835 RepID=UPI0031FC480D
MAESLLLAFREAYQNLDLLPLLDENELAKFRVPYGGEVLAELQQLVEDDGSENGKTIFAGHRGCGKSTLLAEFGRQCQQRGYFVVFFSIADTIEMSDVNHINILFAIAVNLMYQAERENVKIPAGTKEAFNQWFATKTRIETETPVSAEVSVGFNLFEFIRGKLKSEASIRNEIKQEFERKISDLVAQINIMAAAIKNVTNKKVLVIIDDLDKLDLAVVREVYKEHIKALFLPGFQIIYTTPVASLRDASLRAMMITETDNQIVEMPVSKLFAKGERRQPEPEAIAPAVSTLCEVLKKRIPSGVLEPETATQIVINSGGVMRELIRLANVCCRICLRQIRWQPDRSDIAIDQAVLQQGIKELRLDFEMTLGKADFEILRTTHERFLPDDPKEQKFLDLLHGLHVLEYRNDEIWYDLHPIVEELLRRKELIE